MDVKIAQHNNIQANAMGVDYDGKYSVLGARSHIVFIDLNNPQAVAHRLNRQSKWDISNVQWSPCATKKEYFVATYSQWADLWTFKHGTGSLLSTLRGHTRVISDVDWSPCEDNLIATCSIDTYINVWDIRDTKKAKMTPSAVAGASQVKWNKLNPHLLATSHDGDIRIWDIRNDRTPTQYITAHLSKIHSLDWSPDEQNMLASSSQDSTVRFWDITLQHLSQASYQIYAGAPVWKARYTPFGHAMVTALMPTMHSWDNSILLWNIINVNATVHSYVGHRNVVLDFGWRYTLEGTSAELVTWSKDHSLRLWKADSSILTQCGCSDLQETEVIIEDESFDNINIASGDYDSGLQLSLDNRASQSSMGGDNNNVLTPRSGSATFRPQELLIENHSPRISMSSSSYGITPSPLTQGTPPPSSLEREFKLMNIDLPNLSIENADAHHRTCVATVRSNHMMAKLHVNFPPNYPNNVIPNFQFVKHTNISQGSLVKFLNSMREVANRQVRSNLTCLEPCLRMLSNQVEIVANSEMNLPEAPSYMKQQTFGFERIFGTYQDLVNIPFPRTSGARFCGAGHLVTFMRPTYVKGFEASVEPTPRCLATLMTFHNNHFSQKQVKVNALLAPNKPNMSQFDTSPTDNSEISVKSFYYKERKPRKPWKLHSKDSSVEPNTSDKLQMRLHKAAGKVVIQDLSTVTDLNRKLAEEYVVPTKDNYHVACRRNREAAEKLGRRDLVQLWSSLELIRSTVSHEVTSIISSQKPWAATSCGKKFLTSIIDHYSKLLDVQTLAMISCMFSFDHESSLEKPFQQSWNVTSPFHKSSSYNSTENESSNGSHRSNSFCENPSEHWWMKVIPSPPSHHTSFLESPTDSDYRYIESPTQDQELTDKYNHENLKKLLDFGKQAQYDAFKQAYANILDRWKLMNQKTEILKYKSESVPPHSGPVFLTSCQHCNTETMSSQCTKDSCRKFAMNCALCQIPVKKLVSFCYVCGHGGHSEHMDYWFQSSTYCATGCGCECRPALDKTR